MNRTSLYLSLAAALILIWLFQRKPAKTELPALAVETTPTAKLPAPMVSAAKPAPVPVPAAPQTAPSPVLTQKPIVVGAATPDPHKPPPKSVPFKVVEGFVVAYGDILLGKPKNPDFPASGFVEAPALKLWDRGLIPFSIHASLPNPDRILRAITYFNEMTSVHFVPYTGQPDSIVFMPLPGECLSYLGQTGGNQPIYLDDRCQDHEITHELMHALGFIHEHSRHDRDEFVQVNWDNIEPGRQEQFDVTPPELSEPLHGRPFDYQSVMLYPSTAFALDRTKPTLIPRPGETIEPSLKGLSAEDLERVRHVYGDK